MDPNLEEKYSFLVEWYDTIASIIRRYQLLYYLKDGSIEMYDMKSHRLFLKRTKYEDVHEDDLFLGNKLKVYGRLLLLADYGDQYTARILSTRKQRTLGIIKPNYEAKVGKIIDMIYRSGLTITKAKMTNITRDLLQYFICGPGIALEIMGDQAITSWKKLLGIVDENKPSSESTETIQKLYGISDIRNAVHASNCVSSAARELEIFFPSGFGLGPSNTAKCIDCTLCIIKPHAVAEELTGKIMNTIEESGFNINALQMFNVDPMNASEFYEVYKGVVPEHNGMVMELSTGPCIALEILQGPDVTKTFRACCGPADPEIARHLRPNSLRALYGKNKIQNAVHCTDLPEDGVLEVQYFFKILDS
ncbi:nucleoside diphosphate kinase 7 isoform X2 [Callorhinchus milii]|uniref:Nucleoside diphosphate kinase homolog 7 n=1 Tax=Callorhinchus milii TaxID=7868 RepID=V9KX07_CALMI|nr:nucleoside diphosphate kinase 7 isoform X2 [Callorhinchus milii]